MKLEFGLIPLGVASVTVNISTLVILRLLPFLMHLWAANCIFFRTDWAEKGFTETLLWIRLCSLHDLNQGNDIIFQFSSNNSRKENKSLENFRRIHIYPINFH